MTDSYTAPVTEETRLEPLFYVVSPRKFTILFLTTLGGYQLYWFYKNWRCFKNRMLGTSEYGATIWPVPRALFSIFFIHALFREVKQHASGNAVVAAWRQSGHATVLVILILASNVLSRLGNHFDDNFWINAASLIVLIPMLFTMRGAQDMINAACDDPAGAANAELTGANYVWIILGVIFWLAVLLGLFATGSHHSTELGL